MTTKGVLRELRSRGFNVSVNTIMWALRQQKVSRPEKDDAGNYFWGQWHVDELACYLRERNKRWAQRLE